MNPRDRFLSSLIETDALEGFALEGADPTELYGRCQRSATYIVPVDPDCEGGLDAFRSQAATLAQAAWHRVQLAYRKANSWPGVEEELIGRVRLPEQSPGAGSIPVPKRLPGQAQLVLEIEWPSVSGMALLDRYFLSANRGSSVWHLWVQEAHPEPDGESEEEPSSEPRVVAVLPQRNLTERIAALHMLVFALRNFEEEYGMYGFEEAKAMGCLDKSDLDTLDWLVWRQTAIEWSRCSRSFHKAVDEAWTARTNSIEA